MFFSFIKKWPFRCGFHKGAWELSPRDVKYVLMPNGDLDGPMTAAESKTRATNANGFVVHAHEAFQLSFYTRGGRHKLAEAFIRRGP